MDAPARRRLDALMSALADGDRSAFDPVFEMCEPLMLRYASRSLASSSDAEDVAQTALLKMFRRADEYDPARPAVPWVLGIVANEVRTQRRRLQRSREDSLSHEPAGASADPEALVVERDLVRLAEELLSDLAPLDRETLRAAIGVIDRPDVTGATFRKRAQRALARLRSAWKEAHGG